MHTDKDIRETVDSDSSGALPQEEILAAEDTEEEVETSEEDLEHAYQMDEYHPAGVDEEAETSEEDLEHAYQMDEYHPAEVDEEAETDQTPQEEILAGKEDRQ